VPGSRSLQLDVPAGSETCAVIVIRTDRSGGLEKCKKVAGDSGSVYEYVRGRGHACPGGIAEGRDNNPKLKCRTRFFFPNFRNVLGVCNHAYTS
jgi:hypothetical protein